MGDPVRRGGMTSPTSLPREAADARFHDLRLPVLPDGDDGDWTERRLGVWISLFLAIGVALRVVRFGLRYPLWRDEAYLAANVWTRDFAGLARPLDYQQVCPLLFLWVEKVVIRLFGFDESTLRALPTAASIASLFLLAHVARRLGSGVAPVIAVAILAVGYTPIRHGGEFKPYATDFLIALGLIALAVEWLRSPLRVGWLWGLVALGPVAVGMSNPAIFVAASVGLVLLIPVLATRSPRAIVPLSLYGAATAATFLTLFVRVNAPQGASVKSWMEVYWAGAFPPRSPLPLLAWLVDVHTSRMFAYPAGGSHGASLLTTGLVVAAVVAYARRGSKAVLVLLLAPFALGLVAAIPRRYPYGGSARTMQYVAPAIIVMAGQGAAVLLARLRRPGWRERATQWTLWGLASIGPGMLAWDVAYPYYEPGDRVSREFARRFWAEESAGAELVCARTDLHLPLDAMTWQGDRSAVYLCYQAIESARHHAGIAARLDRVALDHPLRVVVFGERPGDAAVLSVWIAANANRYKLRGRRERVLNAGLLRGKARVEERYVVYEFVPARPRGRSPHGACSPARDVLDWQGTSGAPLGWVRRRSSEPIMLDHQASQFYRGALQAGLIDAASLDACWEAIPVDKRIAEAIDRRLARQTITAGHLTLWQAQQILGGRTNGYRIDKYVLLDLIGRGGMGRVYLAKDVRLNRRVALKILSQERMANPRAITRFLREAKVGAQLQHENLVRIYDEGEANGGVRYLVMEYIEGKNVGQLIGAAGAIPWPTAARLARQVALGLEHARLKGLIHRDVNPCNILVTTDGTAKLTDMGLAIDLADLDNVTRDGATVGTFDYVSPEQARHSRSVDTRADLYSLGCTLFHMISGRVPFPVTSLPEKLYAHQLHDPEPLDELVPGVPQGLAAVVARMMRKNPDERQPNPQVAAQELEPYASEVGASSPSSQTVAVMPDPGPKPTSVSPAADSRTTSPDVPASWAATLGLDIEGRSDAGSGSGGSPASGVTDSFFPLDLGPEVPLSGGLRPPARPARPRPISANPDAPAPPRRRWRAVALVAAGLGVIAAVAGGLFLFQTWRSPPKGSTPGGATRSGGPRRASRPEGAILIRDRDGREQVARTLGDAVARAVRSGGEVVLTSSTPLGLSNGASIIVPDGDPLVIRGEDGVRPVLDVEMTGGLPLFAARSTLRLKGLTIVAHYTKATDAPLIDAERDLALEHCSLRAEGQAEGSRAMLVRGGRATITGVLLAGFDRPVDIEAAPRTTVTITQSIIRSRPADDSGAGGVVHILNAFGTGANKGADAEPVCRISLEDATVDAGVFLDVNQFAETTPLAVSAVGSAFRVRSLVEFASEAPTPDNLAKSVLWDGKGNRFQILGPAWVTVPGVGPLPDGPTDLDAWSKLVKEADGQIQPWAKPPETPDPASPRDYALVGEDGSVRGADPARVGPK